METAVLGGQTKLTSSKDDGRWRVVTKRNGDTVCMMALDRDESNLVFSLWTSTQIKFN